MSKRDKTILVSGLVLGFAVVLSQPWQIGERRCIAKAKQELSALGQPPPRFVQGVEGEWANGPWLIFINGWAVFTSRTIHNPEDPRDIAVIRTSDGKYFLSHFHFEFGSSEYANERKPRDMNDFLLRYEQKHGWKQIGGT